VRPTLEAALQDKDSATRAAAARTLWEVERSRAALSVLLTDLEDEDRSIRWDRANTLESIGPEARETVPVLLRLLKHKSHPVRWDAFLVLKQIDADAAKRAGEP
jgi:HEAT repeat protein